MAQFRRQTVKHYYKIFIILISLFSVTLAWAVPPPSGVPIITQKQNALLGKKLMQEIRRQGVVIDDPIIQNYLQTLGQKLLAHTNSSLKTFHFFVLNDSTINAFAMPGGYIGVNSGLIFATSNESELAAVLAHEIAHITQHHMERLLEQVDNINIPATAALMAALLLGSTSGSAATANAATGAAMAVMAGSTQHLLNFTRSNEAEADRMGMQTLYSAGFDPEAMPNFFEQMQRENLDYDNRLPPFLLTHPVTGTRIAESRDKAELYPHQSLPPSLTYALVKARMQVLTIREKFRAISHFKALLNSNTNQNATRYGYALALYEDRKLAPAQTNIDLLLTKNHEIIYLLLKAQIAAEHDPSMALNLLQPALSTNTQYYPLIIQYGETLLNNHQAEAAKIFLAKYADSYTDNILFQQLFGDVQAKAHALPEAYLARAKVYEMEGYNQPALTLLEQALKLPQLSGNTRTKINAKISELKALMTQNQ